MIRPTTEEWRDIVQRVNARMLASYEPYMLEAERQGHQRDTIWRNIACVCQGDCKRYYRSHGLSEDELEAFTSAVFVAAIVERRRLWEADLERFREMPQPIDAAVKHGMLCERWEALKAYIDRFARTGHGDHPAR